MTGGANLKPRDVFLFFFLFFFLLSQRAYSPPSDGCSGLADGGGPTPHLFSSSSFSVIRAIRRLDVVLHQSSTSSLVVRDNSSRRCKQHTKTRSDSLAFVFGRTFISLGWPRLRSLRRPGSRLAWSNGYSNEHTHWSYRVLRTCCAWHMEGYSWR